MKLLTTLALGAALSSEVLASAIPRLQEPLWKNPQIYQSHEKSLVELGPYRTRWVTDEEKWALKLVITSYFEACSARSLIPPSRTASTSLTSLKTCAMAHTRPSTIPNLSAILRRCSTPRRSLPSQNICLRIA